MADAVLALLRGLARTAPVLLLVDDLPWIDRASAAVFGALARRLDGDRVGFLAAFRTGGTGFFDRTGLRELSLPALEGTAAAQLLDARFPELEQGVRGQVLAVAEGNPLALLELPLALSAPQRAAQEPLPEPLPLGRRLQQVFTSRIGALPPQTPTLLVASALEGSGDLAVLSSALGPGVGDALKPAEEARLVHRDAGAQRVLFRHPLVRAAAMSMSTAEERRALHRALAGAFPEDVERRAWHLGEAVVVPDEDVAMLLEQAARHVLGRGDAQACVEMLCRAADLSPAAEQRHLRLARAAFVGAESIGATGSAQELLTDVRSARVDHSASLHYATAAALVMLNTDAPVDSALRLLAAAVEDFPDRSDAGSHELIDAIWGLALIGWLGGRARLWEPFHAALAALRPGPPQDLVLAQGLFADPAHRGLGVLPLLEAELARVGQASNPADLQNLAGFAFYTDRISPLRAGLWRTIQEGRAGGASRRHLVALMDVGVDDFHRGRWEEQAELAAEGRLVCEQLGGSVFSFYFDYHQALLAAVRGRFAECETLAARMTGWAGPRGVGTAEHFAQHALVLAALGRSDWEGAWQHAVAVSPAGVLASHVPHALWVAMDLVEAAVRTGRRQEAEAHAAALAAAEVGALSPRLAVHASAARALVAPDGEAPLLFAQALALPTAEEWPFDAARIRLNWGERLRRSRAPVESRGPLQQALAAFERLGALPWAHRAERELRAAGQTQRRGEVVGMGSLTVQELQIARLAARGLSNREIAQLLSLSPRTVGTHLYRAFPKLGITTRAALRDAIGGDPDGPRAG